MKPKNSEIMKSVGEFFGGTSNDKFETDLEKKLWEMLYRSQMALSIMCLDESNRTRENENDWPAGQKWQDMVGSSHAIFSRVARDKAKIGHEFYLNILRNNDEAYEIVDPICKKLYKTGEM